MQKAILLILIIFVMTNIRGRTLYNKSSKNIKVMSVVPADPLFDAGKRISVASNDAWTIHAGKTGLNMTDEDEFAFVVPVMGPEDGFLTIILANDVYSLMVSEKNPAEEAAAAVKTCWLGTKPASTKGVGVSSSLVQLSPLGLPIDTQPATGQPQQQPMAPPPPGMQPCQQLFAMELQQQAQAAAMKK